ncbi:hypothetical protein N8I74_09920 [Chitiniphilus purpureus]|uniref:Uncharacterized protein n=1 Tax=Chitiniphilus purpureus TaxID=2981137 RepID=A0ABY6DH15_9NEIS|nr:hypothetical protein [Chitiniphilus sp. CD1]UXY13640.1 hypothetical protein N8I74_09920 [Chitiniphilus sp. CD1]
MTMRFGRWPGSGRGGTVPARLHREDIQSGAIPVMQHDLGQHIPPPQENQQDFAA